VVIAQSIESMATINNPIFYLANRFGIPRIESQSVTVDGTTNVAFSFSSDVRFSRSFGGLVLVKLTQSIPTGTTTTLPIVFTSRYGGTKPIVGYNGTAVTVADLPGTGIYLVYYDGNTLQLLGSI